MPNPPRIAVGQLAQETNHFVPTRTELSDFDRRTRLRGEAVLHGWGAAEVEVPGFLRVLRDAGAEVVPLPCAAADSGGPLSRGCFGTLLRELVGDARDAGRLDGVLLALHGAMVTEDHDDPESVILRELRAALPSGTPIGVTLDLHAHVTPEVLQPDVFLIGYREYPHVDMQETGTRAARLLLETLAGRARPVMALAKRPMVVSPVRARTVEPPLDAIARAARAMADAGRVHHAAVFPVQPWLDVPGLGFAALVCADDAATARSSAEALADAAWAARHGFEPGLTPLEECIRIGLAGPGMTLIGDTGDGPTGGAAADRPEVLRALLAAGAHRHDREILLTLCDPDAVRQAIATGIGAEVTLDLGAKVTGGDPVRLTARVRTLSDGRFVARDAGARGTWTDHGPTAVLGHGALRIALRSVPGREWDTNLYRSLGLDPAEAAMVFVKSPGHFRVAFGPLAARVLMADTPGPTVGDMRRIPWTRVTRPLFPLDNL